MTYEAIWQQQPSDILFQNAITIIGKRWNYVLPKSTQWDSKETSIDKTFTCWTLFILETVINYSLLPPLKFHLGSRHFLLLLQKQPLQPKLFNSGLNTLIDWLMDSGQRVLVWTARIRMASTVVGDELVSLQNHSRWPVFGLYTSLVSHYLPIHMLSISIQ